MLCRYCKKPLGFLQRMKGQSYCSQDHQRRHEAELERAAIERLQAMKNPPSAGAGEGDSDSPPVVGPPVLEAKPFSPPAAQPVAADPAPPAGMKEQPLPKPAARAPALAPEPVTPEEKIAPVTREAAPAAPVPPGEDDDVALPSFIKQRRAAPAKGAPRRLDRSMLGELDDVQLPPFVTRGAKPAPLPAGRVVSGAAGTPESEEIEVPAMVSRRAREARGTPVQPQEPQPQFDRFTAPPPVPPPGWLPEAAVCRTPPELDRLAGLSRYETFVGGAPAIPPLQADPAPFRLSSARQAQGRAPIEQAAPSVALPVEARRSQTEECTRQDAVRFALLVPVGPDVENLLEASQPAQGSAGVAPADWLPWLLPAAEALPAPSEAVGTPRDLPLRPGLPGVQVPLLPPAALRMEGPCEVGASLAAGDTTPRAAEARITLAVELRPAEPRLAADGVGVPIWLGGSKAAAPLDAYPTPIAVRSLDSACRTEPWIDFVTPPPRVSRLAEIATEPWKDWLERLDPASAGRPPLPPGSLPRLRKLVSIPLAARDLALSPKWDPIGCEFGSLPLVKAKQR